MSTSYQLIPENSDGSGGLSIDEHSNKFDLETVGANDYLHQILIDADPKDLMLIFLEGIKVCSYWMDSKEFKETLAKLEDYSI